MFFDNWYDTLRVAVVGLLAYSTLVLFVRISGKRTLSKMNAFDLVVTVALGSTLATVLLSSEVALLEGLTGFAVLIVMQFLVAWLSARSSRVRSLVKSEPTLLIYKGEFLWRAMKSERVTEGEIRAAVREQGIPEIARVEAVVLETDGTLSVVEQGSGAAEAATALSGLKTPHSEAKS